VSDNIHAAHSDTHNAHRIGRAAYISLAFECEQYTRSAHTLHITPTHHKRAHRRTLHRILAAGHAAEREEHVVATRQAVDEPERALERAHHATLTRYGRLWRLGE
jgi:hypothetical protein